MVQNNNNRVLTVVPAANDGATSYEVADAYDSNTGTANVIKTLVDPLNTTVSSGAHWVRSVNASGGSAWLRCDSYRKVSNIDLVSLVDNRRTWANVAVGLDGNGSTPTGQNYRTFQGQDDDIVVVSAANTAGLAPNGLKMAWRAKFRLSAADMQTLSDAGAGGLSWNVMQRGLADDPGGQWKMSIVSQQGPEVRVQCVTRDGSGGEASTLRVDSGFDLANNHDPSKWFVATCFMDDSGQSQGPNGKGDGIQVVVNGTTTPEVVKTGLGTVNPSSPQMCGSGIPLDPTLFPGGIGSVYTVGNKPYCNGTSLGDDRFVGDIEYAEVFKQ